MKRLIFDRKSLLVLLILSIIGFAVHIKSFQMVPYGDDWRFIYNYFTHEEVVANFSPFPGILAYMAPYGPSALTIGFLYQIFGGAYYIYYLVPLIFKILTAFVIFLILRNISKELKKSDTFISEAFNKGVVISFLSAVLFLVGTTGIQAIDWSFHINVYIAFSIFVLSLLFQIRFYNRLRLHRDASCNALRYNYGGKLNLILGLLLSLFSILFAPFRLVPLVLVVPLIDLILLIKNKDKHIFLIVGLKNINFTIFIFIFFLLGVFGHSPGDIYSPFPITESIKEVSIQPLLAVKTFLHWIGVSILPAYPAGNPTSFITGVVFLILLLAIFYKYRSKYIILGSALFFIPLILMWIITPFRNIDSGDKYLPLSFLGLCFLIGVLSLYLSRLRNLFMIIILGLVLIQASSTIKIYTYWISIGRGLDFVVPAQKKIMSHFLTPITEPKIIYLDFDNPAVQQSIEFGLGYRVAMLSGTRGIEYFPMLVSKKENLIKLIQGKSKNGQTEKVIENVSAFQYKDKEFNDVTSTLQEILREEIK